jgi:Tfp pilus assembly protein PilO
VIRAHRWEIGGALGAVIVLALGWFFFIGAQNEARNSFRDRDEAAQIRLLALQRRLVELRQQNVKLEQFRAQLARDRQALPTTSALSDFLRELQTVGANTGVSVTGLTVGTPTQVTAAGAQMFAIPMTLVALGTTAQLPTFLDQLQQVQPRAVLINGLNAVPAGLSESLSGGVTLTLTMQIFMAPPPNAGNPKPPAKTG